MKKYRDYYGRVVLVDVVKETEKTVTFTDPHRGFTARYHKATVKLFDTFEECRASKIARAERHLKTCQQDLSNAEFLLQRARDLTESDVK